MISVHFTENCDEAISYAERCALTDLSEAAYAEVLTWLPQLRMDITLTVQCGRSVIPETGEVGASVAAGHVVWVVDPERAGGVQGIAEARLRATLFHELHHQVRGWVMTTGPIASFVQCAVAEGLATAFERDAAGASPPWGQYPPDVMDWVEQLRALPPYPSYGEWMFKHPDGRRWIGYRAGTFIADEAKRRAGRTPEDLVTTPAPEILALAGFA